MSTDPRNSMLRIQDPQGTDLATIDLVTGDVSVPCPDDLDIAASTFWRAIELMLAIKNSGGPFRDLIVRGETGTVDARAGDIVFQGGGPAGRHPGQCIVVPTGRSLAAFQHREAPPPTLHWRREGPGEGYELVLHPCGSDGETPCFAIGDTREQCIANAWARLDAMTSGTSKGADAHAPQRRESCPLPSGPIAPSTAPIAKVVERTKEGLAILERDCRVASAATPDAEFRLAIEMRRSDDTRKLIGGFDFVAFVADIKAIIAADEDPDYIDDPEDPDYASALCDVLEPWIASKLTNTSIDWKRLGQNLRAACRVEGLSEEQSKVALAGALYSAIGGLNRG